MKNWRMKKAWTITLLCLLISGAMLLGGCGEAGTQKTTEKETTTQEAAAPEEKAEEETAAPEEKAEEETTPEEKATEKADDAAEADAEAEPEKKDDAEAEAPAEGEDAEAEAQAKDDAEAEAPAEGEDAEAEVQGEGDSAEGESAEGEGDSAEGDSAEGEGDSAEGGGGDSGSSSSEPVEVPEMAGEVVYKFILEKEVSTSLGGMEQFTAYIELYDTPNEDDKTALLGVCQGSSISYTTATWSEDEDGTLKMPIDEFTIYSTKDIDGVKTFVNIRYNAGMMSNGVVDIPMVDVETPTPVLGNEEADAADGGAAAPAEGDSAEGESAEGEGDSAEGGESEGENPPADAETQG